MKKKWKIWGESLFLLSLLLTGCAGSKNAETTSGENTQIESSEISNESKVQEGKGNIEDASKEENENDQINGGEKEISLLQVQIDQYEETEGEGVSVETSYFHPILMGEDREHYPELQKALDQYTDDKVEQLSENMEELRESAEYLNELAEDESYYDSISDKREGTVYRADSRALSILVSWSAYWGGAHGTYSFSGLNYDTESGKELNFSDVVKNIPDFFDRVEKKIKDQYPDLEIMYPEAFTELKEAEEPEIDWMLGYEGVTVFFNPYYLASFADGAQIVTVYFDEDPALFNERYLDVPKDYVIPCIMEMPVELDIDQDHSRENINIDVEYDEDYEVSNTLITVSDKSLQLPRDGYTFHCDIIKSNDDYYLYAVDGGEGYDLLRVIPLKTLDFDENNILYLGTRPMLSYEYENHEEENKWTNKTSVWNFTDPKHFGVSTSFYRYSTVNGYNSAHINESGYPVTDGAYYTVNNLILRLKKDSSFAIVTAEGQETGQSAQLKEGEYLKLIRLPEDEKWADLQVLGPDEVEDIGYEEYPLYKEKNTSIEFDSQKKIYRITLDDIEDWTSTVNGEDLQDIFDGMIFAG